MIWNIFCIIAFALVAFNSLKAFSKEKKTYNLLFGLFFVFQTLYVIFICIKINNSIVRIMDRISLVVLLSGVFLYCRSALKTNPK